MLLSLACLAEARGAEYDLGADSLPQDGVPKGTVMKRTLDDSKLYPGVTHDYWVYVPAQYSETDPACVMVFQDGSAYVEREGSVRAPNVFDNLIHKGEMPVTIGIFINPGKKESPYDQRELQYVTISDTYARFLLEEIIPEVGKDYNLVDDASGRAICGMSDGGLCSFTVGWERPEEFSKVISHIGSYTRLRGGDEYPLRIRLTRGDPKPIRVFLQDGENDMNSTLGSWTLSNVNMAAALSFARYDYQLEMGTGGHDLNHGGAIFPDTLRWIWRDYPGVKSASADPSMDAVVGQWDLEANVFGRVHRHVLTVTAEDGVLAATLKDEVRGEMKVTAISFEDGFLRYNYEVPPSPSKSDKESKETTTERAKTIMTTLLKVTGNTFEGPLSSVERSDFELDYPVKGQKRDVASDTD
jgi:enterochelin esterase family protein